MTLCELITNPITRMVEKEGKNLDEIAEAVCPKVEYGREKIIRVIKDFLGEEYLIQHAEVLKYDVQKAQLAKKRIRSAIREQKTHQKIDATEHDDSSKNPQGKSTMHGNKGACGQQCGKGEPKQCNKEEPDKCDKPIADSGLSCEPTHDFDALVKEIRRLVSLFSVEDVKKAISVIEGSKNKGEIVH